MNKHYEKAVVPISKDREEALAALMQTFRTIWYEYWDVETLLAREEQYRRVFEALHPPDQSADTTRPSTCEPDLPPNQMVSVRPDPAQNQEQPLELVTAVIARMMEKGGMSWETALQHVVIFMQRFLVVDERFRVEELAVVADLERRTETGRLLTIFATIYQVCRERGDDAETIFHNLMAL